MADADEHGDGAREHKTVNPVHHAAMAGDEAAGVLGAETALHVRLEQVAALASRRQDGDDGKERPTKLQSEEDNGDNARKDADNKATYGAGPGLLRRYRRPEFRATDRAPGDGGGLTFGNLMVPGALPEPGAARTFTNWMLVEPDFFATAGIPLVAGRDFDRRDSANAPSVPHGMK